MTDYEFQQNWHVRTTRDGDIATLKVGDFQCLVLDYDGEFSDWEIKQNGEIVAGGRRETFGDNGEDPFQLCLIEADRKLNALLEISSGGAS